MLTTSGRRALIVVAGLYVLGVVGIVFAPGPVDSGMGYIFGMIREVAPWATQHRIQVAANVLLFVPAGTTLSVLLPLTTRQIALPLIIVAAVTIETVQAELLPARDGDIHDIIANITGGSIGIALAGLTAMKKRSREVEIPGDKAH